ncbi:MAG: hypothetical protein AAF191_04915 [Verrucomicrobiota bacterium]
MAGVTCYSVCYPSLQKKGQGYYAMFSVPLGVSDEGKTWWKQIKRSTGKPSYGGAMTYAHKLEQQYRVQATTADGKGERLHAILTRTTENALKGTLTEPFNLEEVRKILTVADEEWRVCILLGLYAGLRFTDAANLTWFNVDLENGILRFEPRKQRRTPATKNEEEDPDQASPDFSKPKTWDSLLLPSLAGRKSSGKPGSARPSSA